jgi:uncharacterized protein involved in response to NO
VLLCALSAREIIGAGNRRNYPIVGITVLLRALNLLYHLGVTRLLPGADRLAIFLLIHTILLLITVISGRVIPNFTANWLRRHGVARSPTENPLIDRLTVLSTVAVGIAASTIPPGPVTGALALVAAVLRPLRLSRWCGLSTLDEPLLLVLHVAYAWLPIGYVLMGCAVFGWIFAPSTALHALTMGAIGGMILAMTTRVPLGHTGRPLTASRLTVLSYLALTLAVLLRVLGRSSYRITWRQLSGRRLRGSSLSASSYGATGQCLHDREWTPCSGCGESARWCYLLANVRLLL